MPNGSVGITSHLRYSNSRNNEIPRIRFGGTSGGSYFFPTATTSAQTIGIRMIYNRATSA